MSEWWSAGDDSDGAEPPIFQSGSAPLGGTLPSPPADGAYEPLDLGVLGEPLAGVGTIESQRTGWKSPVLLGGVAAGVLVLIMGGWTAFQFFGGGGAGAPEEVLTTMAEAVNAQDPVLAATVVDPDELPMLVELMTEFEGVRDRTGMGASGPVEGTSLSVEDLEVEVDDLAPNVARVVLTDGELSARYDLSDAPKPVQRFLHKDDRDRRDSGKVSVDDYEDEIDAELSAIVVKKGRGWYISPSMTTADLLVESQGDSYTSGDFDEYGKVDFFAEGADSPAAVLEELSAAVASGDPEEIAAHLPSDQGQAVSVFSDAANQLFEEQFSSDDGRSGTFDRNRWELDRAETHTEEGPNGTTRLVIDSGEASVVDEDGDAYEVESEGWELCGQASGEDRECINVLTGRSGDSDGWGDDAPIAQLGVEVLGEAPSVLVREVDGGWKLDPVATALDLGVSLMGKIDQDYVEAATLQPLGGPDVEMPAGQDEAEVIFDAAGFASLAVSTEQGGIYSVIVEDVDPLWFGISDPEGFSGNDAYFSDARLYDDGDRDRDDGASRTFIAAEDTTVLGLGGIANSLDTATVRLAKVEMGQAKVDDAVQGSIDGSVSLYSVPTESDRTYVVEFAASKDATIEVIDGDEELGSYELDGSSDDYLVSSSGKDDAAEEFFMAHQTKSLIAVRGQPGTSFSFRVSELPQGFEGGGLTRTVMVSGGSIVEADFDLGGQFSQVSAEVSWSANADVDQSLSIDGFTESSNNISDSYCPCSYTLSGSGSNYGSVILENYDSSTVAVEIRLMIG